VECQKKPKKCLRQAPEPSKTAKTTLKQPGQIPRQPAKTAKKAAKPRHFPSHWPGEGWRTIRFPPKPPQEALAAGNEIANSLGQRI